jgi:hypothetical protein
VGVKRIVIIKKKEKKKKNVIFTSAIFQDTVKFLPTSAFYNNSENPS